MPLGKPDLVSSCPLVPCSGELADGLGLSFSLGHTRSPTGRAAGPGYWEGLANLFSFVGRTNVSGDIFATQILPYSGK